MLPPSRPKRTGMIVRACCAAMVAAAFALAVGCAQKTPPKSSAAGARPPAAAPVAAAAPATPATPATPAAAAAPPPLLGHVTRATLKSYDSWLPVWEQPYAPDPAAVAAIKANARDVTVLLIMGTWCPDSKRELPRYFATMDAAGIGNSVLTMVGVDRTKKDTEGLTEKFGITRVPTFVFLRNGKEVGRFVERTPAGSTFEAEVARILGGGSGLQKRW